MKKYNLLKVSDEVVEILRNGGRRCDCFLEQVLDNQKAITSFCKHYGMTIKLIDVGLERGKQEPMYGFSDGLGLYTIKGLRLE